MTASVLVCDAADEIAYLQYHLLKEAPDLVVEATSDPFLAIEIASRVRPDVVSVDLALEGVSGPEFIRRLRASVPSALVIARSDRAQPEAVAEALAAGALAYVLRADGADALVMAIRAALTGAGALSPSVTATFAVYVSDAIVRANELEAELGGLRDSVSQGTSAKADFLANISHELRTPITVAKGIAYVLRNPSVPEAERDEFLSQLQASLDKLLGIVDEIITIAEVERGTFELDLVEIDLSPLVRHAVDEVDRAYPDVSVVATITESLPVIADGSRIGGVVRELLDNACRYSPSGSTVELVAREVAEGVTVSITDRGEGLDRQIAAQAFDQPFTTGEGTLRKEKAGVGVGLHLARHVILQHHGVMWSDPLPGGGTRIAFCIPSHVGESVMARPGAA